MKIRFLVLPIVLLLLLPFSIGCQKIDDEKRSQQARSMLESFRASVDLNGPLIPDVEAGDPMPETVGTDVNGKRIALSDYSGEVLLLSFWGGG